MWPFRRKPKITEVLAARVGESAWPEPGSLTTPCVDCGHDVLVGPILHEAVLRGVPIRCLQCACAANPDATASHPLYGTVTLRTMMGWTAMLFPDAQVPDLPGEPIMPTKRRQAETARAPRAAHLEVLGTVATDRMVEFLGDPEMHCVRLRILRGDYGLDSEMACRMAVLEQIGTLGQRGPRLGLLVYCVENTFNLVDWRRVAAGVKAEPAAG